MLSLSFFFNKEITQVCSFISCSFFFFSSFLYTHTNYYIDVLVVVEQTKSRLLVYVRASRSDCGSSIPVGGRRRRRGKKITSLYGRCCIVLAPRTITSNQSIPKLLLLLLASFILHVISFIFSPLIAVTDFTGIKPRALSVQLSFVLYYPTYIYREPMAG